MYDVHRTCTSYSYYVQGTWYSCDVQSYSRKIEWVAARATFTAVHTCTMYRYKYEYEYVLRTRYDYDLVRVQGTYMVARYQLRCAYRYAMHLEGCTPSRIQYTEDTDTQRKPEGYTCSPVLAAVYHMFRNSSS